MDIVVDANVVQAYFVVCIKKCAWNISKSPDHIFESGRYRIYVDDTDHIENEWRSVLGSDFFDSWYSDLVRQGVIRFISCIQDRQLETNLKSLGFPRSKDIWYIRTSKANNTGGIFLIAEDLDFYNPKMKNSTKGSARFTLMKKKSAPVRRLLLQHGITVNCVDEFC